MKTNKDINKVIRTGASILEQKRRLESLRKEIIAGEIVSICVLLGLIFIMLGVLVSL